MNTNHDALRKALEACDVPDQYRHAIIDKFTALSQPMPEAAAQGCAGCGKTSTSDSMWALYCVDCTQKHGIGAMQWIELVHELCPEGIEDLCDECGGEDAKCPAGCTYRKARAMLSASPAAPEGAKPEREIEQLIRERDQRDEIIDRLCDAVLGSERPEWSSAYGFDDAVADVEARITQLHQPSVDKAWKRFEQANAAQPPHPKPQAQGEPEWRLTNHYKADVDKAKKEALAQHRAALEKCVGALEDLRNEVHDSNTFDQPGAFVCCDMPCDGAHSDNCKASAAITNANQVLGKGEV